MNMCEIMYMNSCALKCLHSNVQTIYRIPYLPYYLTYNIDCTTLIYGSIRGVVYTAVCVRVYLPATFSSR